MRAAPFARVFVKFTAAMLGDLQFPTYSGRLSRDFFVIRPMDLPTVRRFQKAGRGRIAFQSERGGGNHIDHATKLTLCHQFTSRHTRLAMTVPAFETTFAVPMTCEACIKDIEGSLSSLSGTSARSNPVHVICLTECRNQ